MMNDKQFERELSDIEKQIRISANKNTFSRGRSVTVGTCFGGMIEIIVRGDGDKIIWVMLSPEEISELIHSLAANIGCSVKLIPRKDPLTHRPWNKEKE